MEEKEEMQPWSEAEVNGTEAYREHIRHKAAKGGFFKGLLLGIFGSCAVFVCAALVFGMHITGATEKNKLSNNVLTEEVTAKLNRLIGEIGLYYYEDVNVDQLVTGIYKGLFEGLDDPYSAYYTEDEYEEMMISATANYYGIGAGLLQDKDSMQVTIQRVYEGSPAEKAGLQKGDTIVQVEDVTATSVELSELVTKIRGEEGTTVHIKIYREGDTDYREFDVVRGNVNIPTVSHKLLDGNIGYIQIVEFAKNTAVEFEEAVNDLQSQGMQGMVIDLRDNGGGMLNTCQEMLDAILPEGVVVYTEDKYGNRQDLTSDAEHYMDIPITVLVNGNTASASEIFAGAIRDFEYGTLIGTQTFGKGIVQNMKQLEDGSAYKMTVSRYFTPCGDNIHKIGIQPDIELEYEYSGDTEADTYDEMKDNQIVKAIEVLRGEIGK